ncbi:MAG: Rrf2 family transcriptional regulator [Patescibacteria group bacterium]
MFGLSTKGDYGLSFLEYLAANRNRLVSLSEVARVKHLSLKYLERLVVRLKKAKLIASKEGSGGGYRLAKPSKQIKLLAVLEILEGELAPTICTGDHNTCPRQRNCAMKKGWFGVRNKIYHILSHLTLADLFEKE